MTGRHTGHARPTGHGRHATGDPGASGVGLGTVGLVRRGARVGVGTTVLLVVLAAIASVFLVATPRLGAHAADRALGDVVRSAAAPEREVRFRTVPAVVPGRPHVSTTPRPGPTPPFATVDAAVRQVMGPDVLRLLGGPTVAGTSEVGDLTRDGKPLLPDGSLSVLRVQSGLGERVRWVEGSAPGAPTARATTRETSRGRAHRVALVPVAVPQRTATSWKLAVGDRLTYQGPLDETPAVLVVSGVYVPLDPDDGFWQADPRMTGLTVVPTPQGGVTTQGALVAAPESYGPLTDALWRAPKGAQEYPESPVFDATWRYPLDAGRLTSADVAPLRRFLVRLDTDPRLQDLTMRPLATTTGLAGILDRYDAALSSVGVLTSFATAGLTALVGVVLALTAGVALQRRGAEVRLLRARGGGVPRVLAQTGVGTALGALPVVLVVALLTALVVEGEWTTADVVEVALVAAVPLLAAAAVVVGIVRVAERTDDGEDALRRRRVVALTRRVVAELALVALGVLAVTTVRSRGAEIAAGRTDWFAALGPVLVAVAAAVLALRVLPWPLGLAARAAARGRGLTGFLGLSRAARSGTAAALPVVAVVVGAAVLALLASLTLSVSEQREIAAYRDVGATARVDAVRMDADDASALAGRPGVSNVLRAYVAEGAVITGGDSQRVVVIGTDPAAYRRLLADTPAPLAAVPGDATGERLPAVVGPGLPLGSDLVLSVRGVRVDTTATVRDPGLVRASGGGSLPAVLVPLDRLGELVPPAQANVAFLSADASAAAALVGTADPASLTPSGRVYDATSATAVADRVSAGALPRFVAATYVVGAALAAVLTLLAVLLLLAATRPARAALVIRLRTMGLPHGGERALAWTEVLPVVAVAALAGAVVGTAAPSLLAPALDLAPLTGGPAHPPVDPHLVAALGAGALVLVLGALALVIDAAAARRGRLADHLRRGDTA